MRVLKNHNKPGPTFFLIIFLEDGYGKLNPENNQTGGMTPVFMTPPLRESPQDDWNHYPKPL